MGDDSDDPIVTIKEVVNFINEEEAIVLGGVDDNGSCSFTKGYLKRQALYTCRTCLDISKTQAGFCYPCLLHCHEGHDTLELYTKRNFRCDCGNKKFAPFQCKLWEEKDDENEENQYNHNFSNSYCICQRPYPDEEYDGNEEMIQCGVCEDWFHVEHLNLPKDAKVPDEYEEMTCSGCVTKLPFLCVYAFNRKEEPWHSVFSSLRITENGHSHIEPELKRSKLSEEASRTADECTLLKLASESGFRGVSSQQLTFVDLGINDESKTPSIFWSNGWRELLCKCLICKTLYRKLKVGFLLDPEDSMAYYLDVGEKRAVEKEHEEREAFSAALSELPHSVASHFAAGVSCMKEALQDFLMKKRESGDVITEAEIRALFVKLRQDLLPDG